MWAALQSITVHRTPGAEGSRVSEFVFRDRIGSGQYDFCGGLALELRASWPLFKDLPAGLVEQCRLTSTCSWRTLQIEETLDSVQVERSPQLMRGPLDSGGDGQILVGVHDLRR